MAKGTRPRHGSKAFYPRKRVKRIYPTFKTFKKTKAEKPFIQGFVAYKAGMTHVVATDTYDKSLTFGQKISIPVTVLECPSLFVFGVRAYEKGPEGKRTVSDVYADVKNFPKDLARKMKLPKKYDSKARLTETEKFLDRFSEIRLLVHTQPRKIKLKKKPEVVEMVIGGKDIKEIWKYAKSMLGKEINVDDIFEEGNFIDVIGITKGKGTVGPVKRFGIKIQVRKAHGHRRAPGAIGAWTPSRVLRTVPMRGQMGFQKRTESNKQILKIGEDGKEVTPAGGFVRFGEVYGKYVLVSGSLPGPKKRLIFLRHALRKLPPKPLPTISHISKSSQQ